MTTLEKLMHLQQLLLVADAGASFPMDEVGSPDPQIDLHITVISVNNSLEKDFSLPI